MEQSSDDLLQGSQRSRKTWKIVPIFQKVRGNLEKSGKKQNHDKVREFFFISLFFICLNLTYTYPCFINIYWYH